MRISDWSSDVCSSDLEVVRPGVDLVQVRIAAVGEGAQQIQRRRRLVVGLDHPLRVGLAACRLEADVVDDVAAIAGKRRAVHFLHVGRARLGELARHRSEEHTSELQSLMRISYAVFCLKKKKHTKLKITI